MVVLLAFLLWSIEAEGFVIPTGSMAPTLMGRHKEITCPECGYVYTVNADREAETDRTGRAASPRIAWGTCENCRFETPVADAPSFSGDRIYVMKQGVALPLLDEAGRVRLSRWDVAVFKLPEEPEVRYIKRMVGMPDEVVRIQGGDVWVHPSGVEGPFERPLRPIGHQQAMQVMVYEEQIGIGRPPSTATRRGGGGRPPRPAPGRSPGRARSSPARRPRDRVGPSCDTGTWSRAPSSGPRSRKAARRAPPGRA